MPLTNYGEPYMLQALFGGVTSAIPASGSSWYVGLIKAKGTWVASTAYSVNDIVIPTNFGGTNYIYVVTTAGTSGSTEPTWPTTANGTVTNGSVVFTEVTSYFYTSANLISNEVSGTSYARVAATNSQGSSTGSYFQTPTTPASAAPASTYYSADLSFPLSGASWGYVCGFFLSNASSAGTAYAWNTLSNFVPVLVSGMTVKLPTSPTTPGLKITLT